MVEIYKMHIRWDAPRTRSMVEAVRAVGMRVVRFSCCGLALFVGCSKAASPPSTTGKPTDSVAAQGDVPPSAASSKVTPPTTAPSPPAATQATAEETQPVSRAMPKTARELVELRRKMDESVWAKEVLAQEHEDTFVYLWDRLIHETDKFKVLREFTFGDLTIGSTVQNEALDWGIEKLTFAAPMSIAAANWPQWLNAWESDGYRIVETEFHHSSFEPSGTGSSSLVAFVIHAEHAAKMERYVVRGNLRVHWLAEKDALSKRFVPKAIDATDIHVLRRAGQAPYAVTQVENFKTDSSGRTAPSVIHPLIVHDLDGDLVPEIVTGGFNRVYRRQSNGQYASEKLCAHPIANINAGAFADFTGDGIMDYVAAPKNGFPHLYQGSSEGTFTEPGREMRIAAERLLSPVNVVPGDIDQDGDLDLFIGQQKPGYFNGDIPTPYYDANDSFPTFLLQNDGQGNFVDITESAGIGAKSHRRNFSASFIDYDDDGDLDLVMTSDFSGTDLFQNDGTGKFTDVTDRLEPRAHAFGMSHTFGDYNLDNRIDFMTVGMSSTTARRLEHLRLNREDFPDYDDARMKMGYGNRLFVNEGDRFQQASFNATVARTGWSWGSTTLDFDNDGDQDIYVVNGQTSGKTTKDYCTRFWCHDVYYKRGERPDQAIREMFDNMAPLFSGNAISWNGYEHNALLMNRGGADFVNVGFLMGVAFEFDSRAAASADLDGDGRVDLLVEHKNLRDDEVNLYIVHNEWSGKGHWIGVHLKQGTIGVSPIGAVVRVHLKDGRILLQHNTAGHSVWVQHANTVHFGLGDAAEILRIDIRWPNGESTVLNAPAVDQYHQVDSDKS